MFLKTLVLALAILCLYISSFYPEGIPDTTLWLCGSIITLQVIGIIKKLYRKYQEKTYQ